MSSDSPKRFERNIDQDGWIALPEYIMDEYGDAYISLGFGMYLHLMPEAVYLEFEEGMKNFDILDQALQDLAARLYPYAGRLEKGADGRVQIPRLLLNMVGIKDRVIGTFIGRYWRLRAFELSEQL